MDLIVKSTVFPNRSIHKYTWTSPDGKAHSQIDRVLIDKGRHSNVVDVRSLGDLNCDTDHSPVVGKVRHRLSVSRRLTLWKLWIL
jgi:hypothetical protein